MYAWLDIVLIPLTEQGGQCESGHCSIAKATTTPAPTDGTLREDVAVGIEMPMLSTGAEPLVVQASTSRRRFVGKGRGDQSAQQDTSTVLVQGADRPTLL